MAKTNNKKKNLADHVHNKKEAVIRKKVMNPFEIHVNKEKMRVIGKKQKNDVGLPGVSRGKALEKRKHTLLKEYEKKDKSNKFTDKRIGERNHNMSVEDKFMARFTAVRVKQHSKKSIFNLADDEVLTHRGQTLSEIEKFDDPRSDDEFDDENETGKLDSDFVKDAHFGGGILRSTGHEGVKTHRELIDQLISESKKRKAEKQKVREATLELTEQLDADWKDLLPLINQKKDIPEVVAKKPKVDDYDRILRELRFEARGTVTDRLKTEDELAKEEKEKLEQLEKERLERMKGFIEEKVVKTNHRSADDLDDDVVYESDPEYMLSYNQEGESNVQVEAEINGKNVKEQDEILEPELSPEEKSGDEVNSDEELETESEDNLSDLKESDNESEEETEDVIQATKVVNQTTEDVKKLSQFNIVEVEAVTDNSDCQQKIKTDLLKRKEMMEQARKELPYTFALPKSYEDLEKTFENQSSNHQSVIIERMIKCNHPSLGEANKDSLKLLFAYLLQHLTDLGSEATNSTGIKNCFEVFVELVPRIHELALLNREYAHNSILEVIKEKHGEYKKKSKQYPGVEVLVFLKLVSYLFTTSDFRHQIVTPCFVFMEQMLNKCKVRSRRDISYGLFVTTLVLEYSSLSKRYLPASINFLAGLLHMAIPKSGVKLIKIIPPFKSTASHLVLLNNCSEQHVDLNMNCIDLMDIGELDEGYKIRVLNIVLELLVEFTDNLKQLSSSVEIFEQILKYLNSIPIQNYPVKVQETYEKLTKQISDVKEHRKLNFVAMEAKKPKALRLYDPKIVEIFDHKSHKVQSKQKAERAKMLHKLKQEKKGALREIRRDKAFLGQVKIQQQIQSDKERRDKVKRIYAEASLQQSELNEIDRKKKRK